MKCPFCHEDNDRVVDSRSGENGFSIRRRRLCFSCQKRFTTYERVEMTPIKVIKRDGSRVPFDRDSLKQGLERACWKRPVSDAQINTVIAEVEQHVDMNYDTEVESRVIGELVMEHLSKVDQVAYVRFASVYRQFQDARDFANELKPMLRQATMMSKSGNHNSARGHNSSNIQEELYKSSREK